MNVEVKVFFHWIEYLQFREKILSDYTCSVRKSWVRKIFDFKTKMNIDTNFLMHVQANEWLSARFCAFFIKKWSSWKKRSYLEYICSNQICSPSLQCSNLFIPIFCVNFLDFDFLLNGDFWEAYSKLLLCLILHIFVRSEVTRFHTIEVILSVENQFLLKQIIVLIKKFFLVLCQIRQKVITIFCIDLHGH